MSDAMKPFILTTKTRYLVTVPGIAPFIVWGYCRNSAHTLAQYWLGIYIPSVCVAPYCTKDILSS